MLAILSLNCGGLQSRNITSSEGLRDSEADELLSGQNVGHDFSLDLIASKVEDRRKTDDRSAHETWSFHVSFGLELYKARADGLTVAISSAACTRELLVDDQLVEVVELREIPNEQHAIRTSFQNISHLFGLDDAAHELQSYATSINCLASKDLQGVPFKCFPGPIRMACKFIWLIRNESVEQFSIDATRHALTTWPQGHWR